MPRVQNPPSNNIKKEAGKSVKFGTGIKYLMKKGASSASQPSLDHTKISLFNKESTKENKRIKDRDLPK